MPSSPQCQIPVDKHAGHPERIGPENAFLPIFLQSFMKVSFQLVSQFLIAFGRGWCLMTRAMPVAPRILSRRFPWVSHWRCRTRGRGCMGSFSTSVRSLIREIKTSLWKAGMMLLGGSMAAPTSQELPSADPRAGCSGLACHFHSRSNWET